MKSWILLAAVAFCIPAKAQSAECRNPMDQNTMNRCAYEDYQAADRALNETYRALSEAIPFDKDRNRLKDAERAWIAHRDSQCAYECVENEGGSIYPMVHAGCLARLTKARTAVLQADLECRENPERCGK